MGERTNLLRHREAHSHSGPLLVALVVAVLGTASCSDVVDDKLEGGDEIGAAAEAMWFDNGFGIIGAVRSDGTTASMCRLSYNGGYHPGQRVQGMPLRCSTTYGGKQIVGTGGQGLMLTWGSASGGAVPEGAYRFNEETGLSYICRGLLAGTYHPGRLRSGASGCSIGFGGSEQVVTSYEVLIKDLPLRAFPLSYGFSQEALSAGIDTDGTTLYLCSAALDGTVMHGKIRKDWDYCSIGNVGKEVRGRDPWLLKPNWTVPTGRFWPAGFEANGEPIGFCRTTEYHEPKLGKLLTNGNCNVPTYYGGEVSLTYKSGNFQALRDGW